MHDSYNSVPGVVDWSVIGGLVGEGTTVESGLSNVVLSPEVVGKIVGNGTIVDGVSEGDIMVDVTIGSGPTCSE